MSAVFERVYDRVSGSVPDRVWVNVYDLICLPVEDRIDVPVIATLMNTINDPFNGR